MSTERSTFGFNSILPSGYRSKAEAFAKCLQDKLRSISGLEDSSEEKNGHIIEDIPPTPHGSLSKYSEEEIADNVFLQGPLSYKRRSIPERTGPPVTNGRYIGSVVDRRGFSSDSEDSENESTQAPHENAIHRRVAELQTKGDPHKRLTSVNSVDSTTSWCSCEDNDDDDDENEVGMIDTFASQIKGSPTIQNPRMRNFRRKGNKNVKEEAPTSAPAENDLFFDFDVECFSPVNIDDEDEENPFDSTQLHFFPSKDTINGEEINNVTDTGQLRPKELLFTPPPSPAKEESQQNSVEIEIFKACDVPTLEVGAENEGKTVFEDADIKVEGASSLNDMCEESCVKISEVVSENKNITSEEDENCDADIKLTEREIEKLETEVNEIKMPTTCEYVSVHKSEMDINGIEVITPGVLAAETKSDEKEGCSIYHASSITDSVDDSVEAIPGEIVDLSKLSDGLDVREIAQAFSDAVSEEEIDEIENKSLDEKLGNESALESEERPSAVDTVQESEVAKIVITRCDSNDSDEVITPRMKLRRCSSLKTWKTPPGTPGRKKIVRFADALGLDLADIRTFLDEIPKIPISAFEDLNCEIQPVAVQPPPAERTLLPMFQQPGMQVDFLQRVRQNNVSLESAILTDLSLLAISGIIRVRNLSFHKSVHIRYSKDSWVTFADLQATYVPGSSDGFADNFSFTLYGHTLSIGDRLEFAIRYDSGAGQFWDNNGGINYIFQCMPRGPVPLFPPLGSSPVDTWTKFY